MPSLTLDSSQKAPITVKLGGVDQGSSYHFSFTPTGVAEIAGGFVSAIDDGTTTLRVWPFGTPETNPIFAEATITVTGDAMTIEFGPAEPK